MLNKCKNDANVSIENNDAPYGFTTFNRGCFITFSAVLLHDMLNKLSYRLLRNLFDIYVSKKLQNSS